MKEHIGVFRLITASVICVMLVSFFSVGALFGDAAIAVAPLLPSLPASDELASTQTTSINSSADSLDNTSSINSNISESQVVQSNNSSKAVAAKGNVLGAVVEKFISPYTANTAYKSVYLKNNTDLHIDIKSLLSSPLLYKIEKNNEPQVLIMHTHTTESFLHEDKDTYSDKDVSRTQDEQYNMVFLGEKITKKLNDAGIKTIHDKTIHDYPEYNGSYDRSAKTVKAHLKKNPSIKVVIDLHRDAISSDGSNKVKPVVKIDGKKAAQVMLVMGSQSGSVTNHSNWQENLKLAVRFQQQLETMYPTLARSIRLMSSRYNQNLSTGSILLEIGTEVNSLNEVSYSAELVGNALIKTLEQIK